MIQEISDSFTETEFFDKALSLCVATRKDTQTWRPGCTCPIYNQAHCVGL